ncbi:hypothetical protein J6590_017018 [Homalodisca vitripennis]|nr:hypothetical protein J6590_017018 [Homalodisca vitripennis]
MRLITLPVRNLVYSKTLRSTTASSAPSFHRGSLRQSGERHMGLITLPVRNLVYSKTLRSTTASSAPSFHLKQRLTKNTNTMIHENMFDNIHGSDGSGEA